MARVNHELLILISQEIGGSPIFLLSELQRIKEKAVTYRNLLLAENPLWDNNDARVRPIQKFINILEKTRFQIFILTKLVDDEWSASNLSFPDGKEPLNYRQMVAHETMVGTRLQFGLFAFFQIETYFRIYLRTLDPIACNGSTDAFKNIHQCLLGQTQLNFPQKERELADEMLELVRLFRNLIHNDGTYFEKRKNDEIAIYRGKQYHFRHATQVDFATWELLLMLFEDIVDLLVKVIRQPKIFSIDRIPDPLGLKVSTAS